jgi:hypothetical protein
LDEHGQRLDSPRVEVKIQLRFADSRVMLLESSSPPTMTIVKRCVPSFVHDAECIDVAFHLDLVIDDVAVYEEEQGGSFAARLELRRKKGKELAAVLRVGDHVAMPNAGWSPIRTGICEAKDAVGFKVAGLWFGWHELDSILAP